MFGERLKELRCNNNLSQNDLANEVGFTANAIYSWEVGKTQPSIEMITKLAKYFNVSTDYLLGFNKKESDEMEQLKSALKNAGLLNGKNGDMTREDLKKAMEIVAILKKDTTR